MKPDSDLVALSTRVGSPLPIRIPGALFPWLVSLSVWWPQRWWAYVPSIADVAVVAAIWHARTRGVYPRNPIRRYFLERRRWNRFDHWILFVPMRNARPMEWIVFGVLIAGAGALALSVLLTN